MRTLVAGDSGIPISKSSSSTTVPTTQRAHRRRNRERKTCVKIVAGAPLPAGWVGKPWALTQGVRKARGAWLLFTDADTFH